MAQTIIISSEKDRKLPWELTAGRDVSWLLKPSCVRKAVSCFIAVESMKVRFWKLKTDKENAKIGGPWQRRRELIW